MSPLYIFGDFIKNQFPICELRTMRSTMKSNSILFWMYVWLANLVNLPPLQKKQTKKLNAPLISFCETCTGSAKTERPKTYIHFLLFNVYFVYILIFFLFVYFCLFFCCLLSFLLIFWIKVIVALQYTNFFYKHNNYKDTYGKKCKKISIILSIMLR